MSVLRAQQFGKATEIGHFGTLLLRRSTQCPKKQKQRWLSDFARHEQNSIEATDNKK